jgi:hypothetical protein
MKKFETQRQNECSQKTKVGSCKRGHMHGPNPVLVNEVLLDHLMTAFMLQGQGYIVL